ncbi:MAG: hypothetical protein IT379_11780 [Deltaproteobacteria bacterium]|nr:hypothetical protein [Deltaproteobacteria bacterium]
MKQPLHVEAAQSLAGLAEFAAVRWSWWARHSVDLVRALPGGDIVGLRGPDDLLVAEVFEHGAVHCVPPPGAAWQSGSAFMLFQERFKTVLVGAGADTRFAHALLGALNEMASNAVEYASAPLCPIATYEVRDGSWCFSVTDVGCGVLRTLRRNPSYTNLSDDVDALRLAVQDGISATASPTRGYGFTHVFRALVNRMCAIRLRTVGARAAWSGRSPAAHLLGLSPAPVRDGFHVAVSGRIGST